MKPGSTGPCVWVLASGPVADPALTVSNLPRPDYVIAADGGTSLAVRLGLVPNLIVGDLDSSRPETVDAFEARGVEVRRYDHKTKIETDTELAVFAALNFVPGEIILLGALGGRTDHALANIMLLANPRVGDVRMRIVDSSEQLFLARSGRWTEISGTPGDTVSLLPVAGDAGGITLEGLEYLLEGATIGQGSARGISNTLVNSVGRVWLDRGMLLVVHTSEIPDVTPGG